MSISKWLKRRSKKGNESNDRGDDFDEDGSGYEGEEEDENKYIGRDNEESHVNDGTKLVYFACEVPLEPLIEILHSVNKNVDIFTAENECIEFIKPVTAKVFVVIDGVPPTTLIEGIEPLKQIDSIFFYTPQNDAITNIAKVTHGFLVNLCETDDVLIDSLRKSREELDKQTAAFSMYNKKEKATRDLAKEAGSFLFFQLFKNVLKNMPKTAEAKKTMVTTCRNYYRGNLTELKNIDEFDKTYKSVDAIPWYTKETFVYKFINKALRTEDVDVLYQFRFYIMDLSEQLELKFQELKAKQKDVLKLYRGLKLSHDEVANFQNSIGNLISTNGYLSTSSEHSVAYGFATKSAKRDGVVRALFEYAVDLNTVQKIVIADIRQYSAFPEEAEVLVDIGASFQIDSCEFDANADLWLVKVHATDQGAALAADYMEYQKKKMTESNIVLMFGNLLLEMGEYSKAERYFDTILNSSNPNDEEIACIFFNFGRTHRLKGDFVRAINCYNRAKNLHLNARPKRLASAGKTLNGLGVVYTEQGRQLKAEQCFQQALKLYKKSIPKKHVDVAGTYINLGAIDCDRQNYDRAETKFIKAKKIYDRSLPPGHPNHALPRVNLGNVYLAAGDYTTACNEYESALKLQEASLPGDHPDIARTLHNLAVVHTHLGNMQQAKQHLERAEETASRTLSAKHPIMALLTKTKCFMTDEAEGYIYTRH
ncbi:unnamed protein product [Rotaria magnacalcarata]|uniref:ADP ribosyltransferase domain-containing protein n=2 Tax=Rotaria magnacalcarata TaxID=392030 RepID=A0A819MBR9_9BILA|nr:unnamed protein product [Rotaria magnacalcarata]CAF2057879.1 unnamed protein product [Rotaria magnacalcarata]CAF3977190.1 unnamed protein product [Rotaria magnacalcarata]CAF4025219.1 unnamed protein product [Rotaria magnacalcarata]